MITEEIRDLLKSLLIDSDAMSIALHSISPLSQSVTITFMTINADDFKDLQKMVAAMPGDSDAQL